MRVYLKTKEEGFIKKAKQVGADYVEDEEAIFIMPGNWIKHENEGNDEYYKLAVRWTNGAGIDIGQVEKGCDNFNNKQSFWIDKKQIEWLREILLKLKSHI